ncbi:hypothetical protein Tco_1497319 [Tanacetum coccineum]
MMPEDPYAYVVAAFQAPPSPDYVPGPEEPEQAPLSLEFVPEHVYSEFMPPEDEVFPAEEQLLLAAVSPTVDSPGYIADSDLEEDEEDPKEDPIDYPADGGDDDGDDDDESSDDNEDDDDDVEEDEDKEEEEHPALANSVPPPVHQITRLLAIPSSLPQIPSPPLLISPPLPASPPLLVSPPPLPASPAYLLRSRAAMIPCCTIHLHLSISIRDTTIRDTTTPTYTIAYTSPPLLLPSTDHSADRPEVCLPPRKRLCIALGLRYKVGESSSAPTTRPTGGLRADYRFVGTLNDEIRRDPRDMLDTDEIYGRLDDAHDVRDCSLGAADRARQAQLVETLRLMSTLQTQVTALQGQQGPASGLAQPEISEEAGSSL